MKMTITKTKKEAYEVEVQFPFYIRKDDGAYAYRKHHNSDRVSYILQCPHYFSENTHSTFSEYDLQKYVAAKEGGEYSFITAAEFIQHSRECEKLRMQKSEEFIVIAETPNAA